MKVQQLRNGGRVPRGNTVKCLQCNTILKSVHRHDYRECGCSNLTFTDGGPNYQTCGGRDMDLVDILATPMPWLPYSGEPSVPEV